MSERTTRVKWVPVVMVLAIACTLVAITLFRTNEAPRAALVAPINDTARLSTTPPTRWPALGDQEPSLPAQTAAAPPQAASTNRKPADLDCALATARATLPILPYPISLEVTFYEYRAPDSIDQLQHDGNGGLSPDVIETDHGLAVRREASFYMVDSRSWSHRETTYALELGTNMFTPLTRTFIADPSRFLCLTEGEQAMILVPTEYDYFQEAGLTLGYYLRPLTAVRETTEQLLRAAELIETGGEFQFKATLREPMPMALALPLVDQLELKHDPVDGVTELVGTCSEFHRILRLTIKGTYENASPGSRVAYSYEVCDLGGAVLGRLGLTAQVVQAAWCGGIDATIKEKGSTVKLIKARQSAGK